MKKLIIDGLVMIAKSPDLLRKRLNAKEKQAEQSRLSKLNTSSSPTSH